MAEIGIICGMESEARALGAWGRDPRLSVAISAARPDVAELAAHRMVARGVRHLVSFGIAGALIEDLSPGDLLVGRAVVTGEATYALANPGASVPGRRVSLAGSNVLVPDAEAKARLASATGAAAVDMETHRVAIVARGAGIACYAIRAVSDPARRALPAAAAEALDQDGRPRIGHVLMELLRSPGQIPAVVRAGLDSGRALRALARQPDHLFPELLD